MAALSALTKPPSVAPAAEVAEVATAVVVEATLAVVVATAEVVDTVSQYTCRRRSIY